MNESAELSQETPASPQDVNNAPPHHEPLTADHLRSRRRLRLPIILFCITCISTFAAGSLNFNPGSYLLNIFQGGGIELRRMVLVHWNDGLIYMGALIAILMFHEMGHYLATVRYRIPASLPFFIPFPISPIGTMGAVIMMAGHRANRKQMFDIGIAGPLAGLVVAIPVLWIGIQQLDLGLAQTGAFKVECPLMVRWMTSWLRPDLPKLHYLSVSQLNPWIMAGWVGLLITGLNMMPVSQLDGGHVIYTLFLQRGRWIARIFLLSAITYVVVTKSYMWSVMIIVVMLIGTDHPPTSDDKVPLGWFRVALGVASLSIPFLCFPGKAIIQ